MMEEEVEIRREERLEMWGREDFSVYRPHRVLNVEEGQDMTMEVILSLHLMGVGKGCLGVWLFWGMEMGTSSPSVRSLFILKALDKFRITGLLFKDQNNYVR